jgi:hypothetical protein
MGRRESLAQDSFDGYTKLVLEHGSGRFEVTGIGPKHVALKITGKNINVPKSWVRLSTLQSTE